MPAGLPAGRRRGESSGISWRRSVDLTFVRLSIRTAFWFSPWRSNQAGLGRVPMTEPLPLSGGMQRENAHDLQLEPDAATAARSAETRRGAFYAASVR